MTICLSMIVRNESAVIRRCLDSVRRLIDCWCIVDTGSTDGTQDIIRDHMHGLPGELYERPWVDFATNRTEALELARSMADYSLIIDADDELKIPPGFQLPPLTEDSYNLDIVFAGMRWPRQQLVANRIPWCYRGVLHEFLDAPGARTIGHLPLEIHVTNDGARRQDPEKYRKDAKTLEEALNTETDSFMRSRYTFYLAQSWRDAGEHEKALPYYIARTNQGFSVDEIFVSWLNAARMMQNVPGHDDEVLDTYIKATQTIPWRVEPIHDAVKFCRMKANYEEGYQIARCGVSLWKPTGLFVETWTYEYGLLDELAICAFWAGRYHECVDACEVLLSEGKIPDHYRERIVANANFARRKLIGG